MKKNKNPLKKLFVSAKKGREILESQKPYKPDAGVSLGLTRKEIRTLVFWASVGISKSEGGSYSKDAPKIIKYFAHKLKIILPVQPKFIAPYKEE